MITIRISRIAAIALMSSEWKGKCNRRNRRIRSYGVGKIILTKSPPHLERVVLIDSFVCVLTSWSCTTFFDFMYMCVRKYMCVDVVFYSLKMYDTDFDRIFLGCCISFHVILCARTRVMFQIMECVASRISRITKHFLA